METAQVTAPEIDEDRIINTPAEELTIDELRWELAYRAQFDLYLAGMLKRGFYLSGQDYLDGNYGPDNIPEWFEGDEVRIVELLDAYAERSKPVDLAVRRDAATGQQMAEKNAMTKDDTPKLMLTLDGSAISAKEFCWLSGEDMGCLAKRTDGSTIAYSEKANPTEAEFYGIGKFPAGLSFKEKKSLVMRAVRIPDGIDELPWTEDVPEETSISPEQEELLLDKWLKNEVTYDDDRLYTWGSRTASQYAPGFELLKLLSDSDRTALGLYETDLGGPASSVPAIGMEATIEKFNLVMTKNSLPYVMVDDEGPIEL